MTYDLLKEPWVPVVWNPDASRTGPANLIEALQFAHRWRAIVDPLPTVEFGLYRLLVALVLDIFQPEDGNDWEALWDEGHFDSNRIEAYFTRHADAFDLFHPTKPFLQTAGMDDEKSKPLAGLLHSIPSGTGANHFHHYGEDDFAVSPAVAARLLTTIAPFMTAGGAGLSPSINGAPPWYVLPLGTNGFETLLMNTPVYTDLLLTQGNEGPAWRSTTPVTASNRAAGASLPESYTWRPRRIQLIPEGGDTCRAGGHDAPVVVRKMKFAPGLGAGFPWIDPNCAYRIDKERLILRPREGREVWRDTGPLILLRKTVNGTHERPPVISQLAELTKSNESLKLRPLEVAIYGLRTDMKMKVFEWQRERLSVPVELLWEDLGVNEAQNAMKTAEDVSYRLRRAIKMAYPREAQGNDKGFDALVDGAGSLYWRELRSHYDDLLLALAQHPGFEELPEILRAWRQHVQAAGWKALRFAIDDLDTDSHALERQSHAYRDFQFSIFPLIQPDKARENKEKRKAKAALAAT
jgi:CRISPR system Cascade subunit CasA